MTYSRGEGTPAVFQEAGAQELLRLRLEQHWLARSYATHPLATHTRDIDTVR